MTVSLTPGHRMHLAFPWFPDDQLQRLGSLVPERDVEFV